MNKKAIAYARSSLGDCVVNAVSIASQQTMISKYAQDHDLELVGFYSDEAVSVASLDRPGLHAAIVGLKAGNANILIVDSLDRLSRDQSELAQIKKLLATHNLTLLTCGSRPTEIKVIASIFSDMAKARQSFLVKRSLQNRARRAGSTDGKLDDKSE